MTGKKSLNKKLKFLILAFGFTLYTLHFTLFSYAEDEKKIEPVIINGDQVEYSTDAKEFTATGNVVVIYKGTKLSCRKLTGNMETKEVVAEGNARLDDKQAVVEGEKLTYNMQNKTGVIYNAEFRSNPYFGRAERLDKVSDEEFIVRRGYMTTCSYDNPHWRMKSRKVNFFPGDKVQLRDNVFYVGMAPLLYMPQYNHSLKEPIMHVQLMAGKDKTWGPYFLTASRYKLTDNLIGRIYLDYRGDLGVAEGFGTNYTSTGFGKGNFKFYYTQERDKSKDISQDEVTNPKVFQRYLIRWRHKWDIAEQTKLIAEYYKIVDSKIALYPSNNFGFLKEYFFREYEKDQQPPTYVSLHHSFNYSSIDMIIQKRANRWYSPGYLEKLPEIQYSLPSVQIAGLPLYFDSNSLLGNYNKKNTSTSTPAANENNPDTHTNRLDMTNKVSIPLKVAFIQFTPFAASRQTFYSEDINASAAIRTVFSSGADMSTKFYRLFNIKSNFLGLDINDIRHIITPIVGYYYSRTPTIPNSKLRQIDGVDSVGPSNSIALELSNKLQTKRQGQSVDLVDFRVNSSYLIKPKTGDKRGSNLSDILFDLEVLPYSWLRLDADATYKRTGNRSDVNYNTISVVNYDLNFDFATDRTIGIGQRYLRKGTNEITLSFDWRINPKWKFSLYQKRNKGHDPAYKRGLREQEYTLSRDLHCWEVDLTYNVKKGGMNAGEAVWLVFRLKAFPELQFEMNQSYHAPKPGSQSPGELAAQ